MGVIEGWKLKREICRIGCQFRGLLSEPYEILVRWTRRSARKKLKLPEIVGIKKNAVFVIFQPNGVAPSVFKTVEHLMQSNFATFVFSNGPLSNSDRLALEKKCTYLVQRDNFGYDFGAYKDAIDALPNQGADLDLLLLLNDSVWFPIKSNSSLLSDLAANPADVVAAQIFGEALAKESNLREQDIILGSYCLMFKKRALKSHAFQSFWRSYKMSSNKEITLRRGEKGLSKAIFQGGLQCAGVYSQRRFEKILSSLGADDLRVYTRDAVFLDPKLKELRAQLLLEPSSPEWCSAALKLLIENSRKKNFVGSNPRLGIEQLGVEVIKKNNEMLYRMARKKISIWLKSECPANFDQGVVSEITKMADKDNLPKTVKAPYATR